MLNTYFIFLLGLLTSCAASNTKDTGDDSQETTPETTGSQTAACLQATKIATMECFELNCLEAEPLTCSYGDVSYNGDDCGCYTEGKLYELLCDAGNDDSLPELEAGVSCQ